MIDRRKLKRLETPVQVTMKLLGTAEHPQPIKAETRNVSPEGLSIELEVILRNGSLLIPQGEEPIRLIPFLVLNRKIVELAIWIPPKDERIRALGRVVWYDFGSSGPCYYFKAGIVPEEMEIEDRKKWARFVRNVHQVRD